MTQLPRKDKLEQKIAT